MNLRFIKRMERETMENIIRLENVSYEYSGMVPALLDVSLSVEENDMLAVIGSNGSGKSTLLHIMNALVHPTAGKVFYKNKEITGTSLKDKDFLSTYRGDVGYVFQNSDVQLFCPTVFDELVFGPLELGLKKEEAIERANQVLSMLSIEDLKDRPSYMLSGGEQKRVAIGSVLTMNPRVILLDEPTSGLDPKTGAFLTELLFELNDIGKTIVIATHDLTLVDHLQSKTTLLSEDHRIVKNGKANDILNDTDLLIKANLIHEHLHRHGDKTHRHPHSHYFFHKH